MGDGIGAEARGSEEVGSRKDRYGHLHSDY